ncbi:ankyrin repeat domain-containing protein [Diaphorobacter aerolatus]|uniref:Ankyrin repeat domain-containing protein n=1 Tax=Diaphorobacter aerolatus TaxID=1288495 RepID=A0A7H0GJF0_9BURK|nr:ankyrin repeat domain-containing protein [Diaphorobacter aerolatus]QNP48416.1 ankyrin repeat domain-containing protein [Diaphorobacter aerolatus]
MSTEIDRLNERLQDMRADQGVNNSLFSELVAIVQKQQSLIAELQKKLGVDTSRDSSSTTSTPTPSTHSPIEPDKFYTKKEAAHILRVTIAALDKRRERGDTKLKVTTTGGRVYYFGKDILSSMSSFAQNDYPVFHHEQKFYNEQSWVTFLVAHPDFQPELVEFLPTYESSFPEFSNALLSQNLPQLTPEIAKDFDTSTFLLDSILSSDKPKTLTLLNAIKHLANNGVAINQDTEKFYRNSLHVLAMYGDTIAQPQELTSLIECLIDNGADINALDNEGKTPTEIAPQGSNFLKWYDSQSLASSLENLLVEKSDKPKKVFK